MASSDRGLASLVAIRIHHSFDTVEGAWLSVEEDGHLPSSFQRFVWLSNWQRTVGTTQGIRPVLVVVELAAGTPCMVLPLGLVGGRLVTKLVWLGGDSSGYHGPLIGQRCPPDLLGGEFAVLWRRVVRELPRFDYVHFERQPPTIGAFENPFLRLGETISTFASPVVDLGDDWEVEYQRRVSRKSRETDRRKVRRMASQGEVEFVVAVREEEIDEIISTLVVQKTRWLRALGLFDLFEDGSHERLLRELKRDHPDLVHVSAIKVGGTIRATHWAMVNDGTFYYWFASYEQGELSRYSPGDLLVRSLMEWCCSNGVSAFDFGIGDHGYKVRWADRRVPLHEWVSARSLRGWLFTVAASANRWLRRTIKRSPRIYALASAVRARLGREPAAASETDPDD